MKNLLALILLCHNFVFAQNTFPKGDIYTHHSGQKISIPNRSLAFVDIVDSLSFPLKRETMALIGEPNYNPNKKLSTSISIPPNESVIVRFTNNKIRNIKDKDLCIFSIDEMTKLECAEIAPDSFFTRLKLVNNSIENIVIDAIAAIGTSRDRDVTKRALEDYHLFTSNSYVTLKFKDYRQWDGDKIKITVNGETVIRKSFLSIWWKKINIALNEGENSINITALNNGYIHPNTVKIRIYDGDKRYDTLIRLRKRTQKTIFVERG